MALDTYEVWAKKLDDTWCRIVAQRGEERVDTFESKKEAIGAANAGVDSPDNKEIVVIQRTPILRLNAAGMRPKAKSDEDPEREEEEQTRKKGGAESPAGGFRLLKNAKKGDKHEDDVRGVDPQGGGGGGDARAGS